MSCQVIPCNAMQWPKSRMFAKMPDKIQYHFRNVLKMLIRQGKTVILVAHNKDHHLFKECGGEYIEIVNSNQIKF